MKVYCEGENKTNQSEAVIKIIERFPPNLSTYVFEKRTLCSKYTRYKLRPVLQTQVSFLQR
jgi:hypothetical protein